MDAQEIVINRLAGFNGLAHGTNLFGGPPRPAGTGVPLAAVFVLPSGGRPREGYVGQAVDLKPDWVEVTVRGEPNGYESSRAMARAVMDRLHHAQVDGVVWLKVDQSAPEYVSEDDSGSHEWEFIVEVLHRS